MKEEHFMHMTFWLLRCELSRAFHLKHINFQAFFHAWTSMRFWRTSESTWLDQMQGRCMARVAIWLRTVSRSQLGVAVKGEPMSLHATIWCPFGWLRFAEVPKQMNMPKMNPMEAQRTYDSCFGLSPR